MKNKVIKAELSHEDIVNIIRGCNMPYKLMQQFSKLGLGSYTGGLVDEWKWQGSDLGSIWEKYTSDELWKIYQNLRQYQQMENLCNDLNRHLPCKSQSDVDIITELLTEKIDSFPERHIYWSKEVYHDAEHENDKCLYILIFNSNVEIVPSENQSERPGVIVRYKNEKEN